MWNLDNLNGDIGPDSVEIREVWDYNLEEELSLIRSIIDGYPFVSIDTEFPGILNLLDPASASQSLLVDLSYNSFQYDINTLKLIQLGLTFFDSSGHLPLFGSPPGPCIWQFNFGEFDPRRDFRQGNSMVRLRHLNIDLEKNHHLGIIPSHFSELFSLEIMQNDSLHWITFNRDYDFAYLLKTLTCSNIPYSREEFNSSLRLYFPKFYDLKLLMGNCNIYGQPNKVAEDLGVKRVGTFYQVGPDSLIAAAVFKKLKDRFFNGSIERFKGVSLHGD